MRDIEGMIGIRIGQANKRAAAVQTRSIQMTVVWVATNLTARGCKVDLTTRLVDCLHVDNRPIAASDRIL